MAIIIIHPQTDRGFSQEGRNCGKGSNQMVSLQISGMRTHLLSQFDDDKLIGILILKIADERFHILKIHSDDVILGAGDDDLVVDDKLLDGVDVVHLFVHGDDFFPLLVERDSQCYQLDVDIHYLSIIENIIFLKIVQSAVPRNAKMIFLCL